MTLFVRRSVFFGYNEQEKEEGEIVNEGKKNFASAGCFLGSVDLSARQIR